MTGKQKCKILKEIRRQIALQNDIRFVIEECTHKGKCRGTCPKCEWEVRMLERELEKRRVTGKQVVLAGISAGFLLTSCSPIDTVRDLVHSVVDPLEGDMLVETTAGVAVATESEGELAPEFLEGEPAVPVEEEDDSEEEMVLAGVPMVADTENGETSDEADCQIPGETMPEEREEVVLEGDVVYPDWQESEPS